MNLIHRSIWNAQTGTFVAVSEITRGAGKKISSCTAASGAGGRFSLNILAVSLMMACGASAYAQPAGGVVSAGSATIGGTAGAMTITQTTPKVAINWQSFGIKAGESVQFLQPGSNSVALNRVIGSDPSNILGSLSSNGKVFLVNPNGILFGQGATVNVGGLVASTLAITDANFMANNYKFSGAGLGSVVNQGTINAADGGYVALLGANVSNQGVMAAQLGTVALAAGNAVTLDMAGDKLLNVTVDQGAVNALVDNGGMIRADGGQVLMTTQAAGSLLANAVNNTGVVQAQTLVTGENGTIKLLGGMETGTMNVAGTLDASAPSGGNGGFVETSAAQVKVQDNARVTTAAAQGKTGNWLIDPPDFTIGAGGDIAGSTLGAALVTNNITIQTATGTNTANNKFGTVGNNGDIFVNDAVSWTASGIPTTLTLRAVRDVNVNAAITATKGNLVVCCGRDVNVNAKITTTNGSVLLSAGRDVKIERSGATSLAPDKNLAGMTTTDGNIEICAARDVILNNAFDGAALITLTRGSVTAGENLANLGVPRGLTLRAGTAATEPGPAGGTVNFINGGLAGTYITTTGPAPVTPTNIFYNPTSYTTPTDYSSFFTGTGSPLTQYMLVYPGVTNKTFKVNGDTTATLSGFKSTALSGPVPGTVMLVAGPGATANFNDATLGVNKTVTYSGFSLAQNAIVAGGTASNYALPVACCAPFVSKTTGNVIAAVVLPPVLSPVVVVQPPVETTPVDSTPVDSTPVDSTSGELTPLPDTPYEGPTVKPQVTTPGWMPVVVPAKTPPQLLTLRPVPPIAVPVQKPVVVAEQPPVVAPVKTPPEAYVAPKRAPKPYRN